MRTSRVRAAPQPHSVAACTRDVRKSHLEGAPSSTSTVNLQPVKFLVSCMAQRCTFGLPRRAREPPIRMASLGRGPRTTARAREGTSRTSTSRPQESPPRRDVKGPATFQRTYPWDLKNMQACCSSLDVRARLESGLVTGPLVTARGLDQPGSGGDQAGRPGHRGFCVVLWGVAIRIAPTQSRSEPLDELRGASP